MVSINFESLLMVNSIIKVSVNIMGILKVMDFCYIVVIQLKIFILVGIDISMVVNIKNILVVIGILVVNMWWVYIIKFSSVIEVVVQIMEV